MANNKISFEQNITSGSASVQKTSQTSATSSLKNTSSTASFSQRINNLMSDQRDLTTLNNTILDELNREKEVRNSISIENVYDKSKDVITCKTNLDSAMDKLCDKRIALYENLITVALAKYYYKIADSAVTTAEKSDKISRTFNTSINTEFLENLDAMSRVASTKDASITTLNGEEVIKNRNAVFTQTEKDLLKKYGSYFLSVYDNVKESAELGETSVDYRGMVGKSSTLVFDTDESEISGDIIFKNDEGKILDIENLKETDTVEKISIGIVADIDILAQDGSAENPYIINSEREFLDNYCNCNDASKNFALSKDLNILSANSIRMTANLNGNGHSISFIGTKITTGISCTISNLTFRLLSILDVDINVGNTLENVMFIATGIYVPTTLSPLPPTVTFNGRAAEDIDQFFPTSLSGVRLYSKSSRTFKATLHDDDSRKFGFIDDPDDDTYKMLVLDNKDSKKSILYVGSLKEPTKYTEAIENIIIEKGALLFNGELSKDLENDFLFTNDDGTVSIEFSNDFRDVTINKLKYSIKIDDTNSVSVEMPEILKVTTFPKSKIGKSSNPAISKVATMTALANLAAYTYFDERSSNVFSNDTVSILKDIIDNISQLRFTSETTVNDANETKTKSLGSLTNVIQSYTYINSMRAANDSCYDTSYTVNLESMMTTMTSYSALLTSDYEITGAADPFKNMIKYLELINIETDTLIIGLVESIKKINTYIDNYQVFHTNYNSYGSKFEKMCLAVSDVINDDTFTDNANTATFTLIVPNIRKFSSWISEFTKYTNDGQIMMSQIYISQEICINSLKYGVQDPSIANYMLKSLVNQNMLSSFKKKLICDKSGKILNIIGLDYEAILVNDYKIQISEDAPYEDLAFQISDIDPSLGVINNINVRDILLNSDGDVDSVLEIISILDLNILKYILKDSVDTNVVNRVNDIIQVLNICSKNFKTLLFEYRFRKILDKIVKVTDANKTSLLYGVRNKLSEHKNYSKSKELLSKYISVWTFKYYSEYARTGSLFRFINDEDFISFMYNYSSTKYAKEFEIRLNAKGVFTKIWNNIKDLWNNIVDFLS